MFRITSYNVCYTKLLRLCNVIGPNSEKNEQFFGIDNGIGYLYKKKSRDSAMFRLIYKIFKLFFSYNFV